MKKLLLSATMLFSFAAFSQTTLLFEDFETGGASFTMNTATLGGMSGLTGDNAWVVNNAYTGGSGTSSCLGFGFSLGNTPNQPAGITNGPNSNYMHILSDDGTNNGVLNANYSAADGALCFFAQTHFTEMTSDVSTSGMTNTELDFWWMCAGDVNAFGELYYSLDMGTTWVQVTAPITNFYNVGQWTQQVITDPAWDNQPNLRFGFRFVNNVATAGSDPSFSIDDFIIRATSGGGSTSISTDPVAQTEWCYGTTVSDALGFTATGTYNPGNVYSAEMSDATGSFAAPTVVGTLTSSANGALSININIPGSMPAGNMYRIRVVASDPATTGSDNGSDITIWDLPTVSLGAFTDVCHDTPTFTLTGGVPTGGVYSGPGVAAGAFDPAAAGVGTHTITYTYADGNGCTNMAQQTLTVDSCAAIGELGTVNFVTYPNPVKDQFAIATDAQLDQVALRDMHGRLVKVFDVNEETYDVRDLENGIYMLTITSQGTSTTTRLIKQ